MSFITISGLDWRENNVAGAKVCELETHICRVNTAGKMREMEEQQRL